MYDRRQKPGVGCRSGDLANAHLGTCSGLLRMHTEPLYSHEEGRFACAFTW
jgi:hypothetical protein